MKPSSVFWT